MDRFKQIQELVRLLETDADKFYNKGNSKAGTRLRKGMQELKVMASVTRKEIQETKSSK